MGSLSGPSAVRPEDTDRRGKRDANFARECLGRRGWGGMREWLVPGRISAHRDDCLNASLPAAVMITVNAGTGGGGGGEMLKT